MPKCTPDPVDTRGGVFGIGPRTPAIWTAEKRIERVLSWPFADGRTPYSVLIATLLGILLISIISRVVWPGRALAWLSLQLGILGSANRSGGFLHFADLICAFIRLGVPQHPNRKRDRSSFLIRYALPPLRPRSLCEQIISLILIVAVVFTTTNTNVYAQSYDPVFYYYHGDHLGSTNVLTDRNGYEVDRYVYSAYGQQRTGASGFAFPATHRFTGQPFDDETGLAFYQSRYYDPELARFVQPDTIVPDPSSSQALNRYTYVGNNPLKYTDPSGHDPITAIIVGVVIGAVIGGASAAASGGDIGMGILTGAVGGFFGGVGAATGSLLCRREAGSYGHILQMKSATRIKDSS